MCVTRQEYFQMELWIFYETVESFCCFAGGRPCFKISTLWTSASGLSLNAHGCTFEAHTDSSEMTDFGKKWAGRVERGRKNNIKVIKQHENTTSNYLLKSLGHYN